MLVIKTVESYFWNVGQRLILLHSNNMDIIDLLVLNDIVEELDLIKG